MKNDGLKRISYDYIAKYFFDKGIVIFPTSVACKYHLTRHFQPDGIKNFGFIEPNLTNLEMTEEELKRFLYALQKYENKHQKQKG